VVIYFCLSMMFSVHSSRSRNDEWVHAKYILTMNLVMVLLDNISINYVSVWFSGGKGLTHVWSEAGILSFSFHGQNVHWEAIVFSCRSFQTPHQTDATSYMAYWLSVLGSVPISMAPMWVCLIFMRTFNWYTLHILNPKYH